VRWTLGQTGHGWRSGLDGGYEWSCLCLPAAAWARTRSCSLISCYRNQAVCIQVRIRYFYSLRILVGDMGLRRVRGIYFESMSRENATVETKPAFPNLCPRVWGLEIRRFSDLETRGIGETRLCCFDAGRTRRCALGSAEPGRAVCETWWKFWYLLIRKRKPGGEASSLQVPSQR
jgi:hypothetical protein